MGTRDTIYIQLDSTESWVVEYSPRKIRPDLIGVNNYPDTLLTEPLNHRMVAVEENGEVWYDFVYEVRELEENPE